MAKTKRETIKYHFKVDNKIVHGGITDREISEREAEHKVFGKVEKENGKTYDWSKGHIVQKGIKTTREAALKCERDNGFGANQIKQLN